MPVGPAKSQSSGDGDGSGGTVIITSAVPPALNMSSLNFTYPGQVIRLTATNVGTVPLEYRSAGYDGPFNCWNYWVTQWIQPGQTIWADMVFIPPNRGTFSGTLWISNGAETTRIPMTGTWS